MSTLSFLVGKDRAGRLHAFGADAPALLAPVTAELVARTLTRAPKDLAPGTWRVTVDGDDIAFRAVAAIDEAVAVLTVERSAADVVRVLAVHVEGADTGEPRVESALSEAAATVGVALAPGERRTIDVVIAAPR